MPSNQIKVTQIDNDDLLAFLQSSMGLTIAVSKITHTRAETFGTLSATGPFTVSGVSSFANSVIFGSGFSSLGDINVQGRISGQSIAIDTFNIPSGTIGSVNIGTMRLTGVPIYPSGMASTAVTLASGTVFGIEQFVNNQSFEHDASGNLMPYTGTPTKVILLCVSIGS